MKARKSTNTLCLIDHIAYCLKQRFLTDSSSADRKPSPLSKRDLVVWLSELTINDRPSGART